ncbi:hypothetical protein MITS9508_00580 [Synechococcus sp. MIT S9508]|nr:hypothetical protein MITS9508_00580 [Synechococcus sp. MIT S9508]
MYSLVKPIKKYYWGYCLNGKVNPAVGIIVSTVSRSLVILNNAICFKYSIKNRINLYLFFLEVNDHVIFQSLSKNFANSADYLLLSTLIERENISKVLFHYYMLANRAEYGIKLFEALVATDPANKMNWRGLLDLPFYIGDEKRVNKYFDRYIAFKNNQAISDNIDLTNNMYLSEYFTYSIGHLSIIVDYALAMQIDNRSHGGTIFISLAAAKIANKSILDLIVNTFKNIEYVSERDVIQTQHIKKYENPFVYKINFKGQWCNWYEVRPLIHRDSGLASLNRLLKIPIKCKEKGFRFMQSFGFSQEDWFVTIHIRDRNDGSLRNSKTNTYIEAIHQITSKGGWVVRIGGKNSIPLPRIPNVIDYTQIVEQSHFLDTYFLAECLFSIQTTSGPANIPILFGRPTIQANCFPIRHTVPCYKDIFMPKLVYSKRLNRTLNFSEVFLSSISSTEISSLADDDDLSVVDNSSLEILEACNEMLAALDSSSLETLTPLQARFNDIAIDHDVTIFPKISKFFIEQHKHLI